jgi:hypothetical protein
MIFTGEASWRWRMMLPAADHSYDRFWRQAVRWLGQNAPSPVHLTAPAASTPGAVSVEVTARDASFAPYPDAQVDVRLAAPDGRVAAAHAEPADAAAGRYRATLSAAARGTYRVTAEVRRGANVLGAAAGVLLVGGVDPEFTDPRMDTGTLSRIARASGGAVVSARDLPSILERLRARGRAAGEMQREDLWSKPWSFAVLASLLGGEWLLRRRWGLR